MPSFANNRRDALGRYAAKIEAPLEDRFRAKYKIDDGSGCWIWTGYIRPSGYGEIQRGSRGHGVILAHRASWLIHHGEDPGRLHVCHHCDNPPCVNPGHLFLGTMKDNMDDMMAKGRYGKRSYRCGESHHAARLTCEAVRTIRALSPAVPRKELASRFGVSRDTIGLVLNGKIWRHVA